nr:cellulose synthase-like protein D3 [Tanacetum cinerariifolium]
MSNGPFILNLDCDHYVYNSQAMREGMCFMMDDPSERYANHNTVFFDGNMRALDRLQGPVYVGTGCLFRRIVLYGFDPPRTKELHASFCSCCCLGRKKSKFRTPKENQALRISNSNDENMNLSLAEIWKLNSSNRSIPVAEFQGRLLADHPSDKTERGLRVRWIYGSVTEDVITCYWTHNRGWKSVYCVTKRDTFRATSPINLTDRLHQVLSFTTAVVLATLYSITNTTKENPDDETGNRYRDEASILISSHPHSHFVYIILTIGVKPSRWVVWIMGQNWFKLKKCHTVSFYGIGGLMPCFIF